MLFLDKFQRDFIFQILDNADIPPFHLIFDYGTEVLDELLGGCGKITAARCGYGLFIAERPWRK